MLQRLCDPVEYAIQPVSPGCKDSLFAGSGGDANRWVVVASRLETAKLNGIEPFAWLHDRLTTMVNSHSASRLDDLLPGQVERATAEIDGKRS